MKGKIDPLGIEMENAMLDNNQQYLTVTITWLCEPDFNRAFHALQTYDLDILNCNQCHEFLLMHLPGIDENLSFTFF